MRRRSRPGPLALRFWLAAVLLFLYLPIVVMALLAFNASPLYRLPFEFDPIWFQALADNDRLLRSARNSLAVALLVSVIATALGTLAAIALARYRFRGRTLLQILLFPPIAIPWLVLGTAMLVFFFLSGIGRGFHAILLGHVALAIPYVVFVVGARLASHPPHIEEAAQTLGARPLQVLFRVTLPVMAPAIVGAALFAFAVSFDQFVISYFLAPPGFTTLPVEIYAAIRKGFTPEINAISTIIILISMVLLLAVARLYRFSGDR